MLAFYLSIIDSEEDKLTFTKLYNDYKLVCYHVALRITHNKSLAEDAVHNAFLTIIQNKELIFNLPCGKIKSRIVIITKNKAIDLLRKENLRRHDSIDDLEWMVADENIDLSEIIKTQEDVSHLKKCVSLLPEIYKSVIQLKYTQDMDNREIAKVLKIEAKTVSMRISRAKLKLKEMLTEEVELNG